MTTTNWRKEVRQHQQRTVSTQQKLQQCLLDNFEDIASEVILNVLTAGWRRDIARDLIEDYYREFYSLPVSGVWVLHQLEREGYIDYFRDEVAWGEHDDFVQLREKGKQITKEE